MMKCRLDPFGTTQLVWCRDIAKKWFAILDLENFYFSSRYHSWIQNSRLCTIMMMMKMVMVISPSLHFNGHFGLAGVYWSKGWWRWWWQLTTGAISRAKLQSNHLSTNKPTSSFFTGRMPFLSPNQQCQSTDGENITFHGLAYPKLTWRSSNFVSWPLIAPGYLGGGLPCLSSSLWCQYPMMKMVT